MMNSSMLKKEIMEMRQQMMKVKDSLAAMQEILDRAEQMGILLAAVEQNNIVRAQEV